VLEPQPSGRFPAAQTRRCDGVDSDRTDRLLGAAVQTCHLQRGAVRHGGEPEQRIDVLHDRHRLGHDLSGAASSSVAAITESSSVAAITECSSVAAITESSSVAAITECSSVAAITESSSVAAITECSSVAAITECSSVAALPLADGTTAEPSTTVSTSSTAVSSAAVSSATARRGGLGWLHACACDRHLARREDVRVLQ
jgi:hypothetical protein